MGFSFKWADIGMNCGFETKTETKEELLTKIAEHAKAVHNMATISPDVMAKVEAAVKQV